MAELNLDNIAKLLDKQTSDITNDIEKISYNNDVKLSKLQRRCVTLERKLRRNNVVMFGLNLNSQDLITEVIEQLNDLFNLRITNSDINNIYKVGKNSRPPVVVEFVSFLKKREIFKDTEKLKSLKTKNIAVSNDLCIEDRMEQKILRRHYKLAKEETFKRK